MGVPWRSRALAPCLLLVAATLVGTASALYEDQVGINNWHKKYVGQVKTAVVGAKRVYVATEQNVFAGISAKTGTVDWRHVLEEADSLDDVAAVSASSVATVSKQGKFLRCWGAQEGDLLWEEKIFRGEGAEGDAPAQLLVTADRDVVVLARNTLQRRRGSDGELMWEADFGKKHPGVKIQRVERTPAGASAFAFGTTSAGAPFAAEVALSSGEVAAAAAGPAAAVDPASPALGAAAAPGAAAPAALALSASGELAALRLSGGALAPAFPARPLFGPGGVLKSARPAGRLSLRPLGAGITGVAAEGVPGFVAAVTLDASSGGSGGFLVLGEWPSGAALSARPDPDDEAGGGSLLMAVTASSGQVSVSVVSGAGKEASAYSYPANKHVSGAPVLASLGAVPRKGGDTAHVALVAFADRAVQLSQRGQAAWTRHEALADIRWASFAELPEKSQLAHGGDDAAAGAAAGGASGASAAASEPAAAAVAHGLTDRLRMQWLDVKRALKATTPEEAEELKRLRRTGAGQMREWRDANGFRRMIVLLAATGKVYALHNGDGRLLWARAPGAGEAAPTAALLWRQPLHHTAQPLLLLISADQSAGRTDLRWLNQYTGAPVGKASVNLAASRVERLPAEDSEHRRVLLLWDAARGRAAVFPQTPEAAEAVAARVRSGLVLASVNHTDNSAAGFVLRPPGSEAAPADPEEAAFSGAKAPPPPPLEWAALPVWRTIYPNPIVEAAFPPEEQSYYTRTKVLGDRSMLFKFLTPNLLFVATTAPPPPGAAAQGEADPALEVHLTDSATGQVLYRVRHGTARGPLRAVMCENWVVYSYWNTAAARVEVSVLEMFQDAAAHAGFAGAVLRAVVGGNDTAPVQSSLSLPPLRILGQSYFLAPAVKVLGVTTSSLGVTSKHVLMGTLSDHIISVDRRFLDPRRPLKPSRDDQEEGLVPYSEWLPVFPQSFVAGPQTVARLRGFVVAAARVESTSLLFAHGLDLFYGRLAPSQTFDLLGEEFSSALLAATLAALAAGAAALAVMVKRDDLRRRWR